MGRLRELGITPQVPQNDSNRRSAIDGRTTGHHGYTVSQRKQNGAEEVFRLDQDGGAAAHDPLSRDRSRGLDVHSQPLLHLIACATFRLPPHPPNCVECD
jgi:hypothetical protein